MADILVLCREDSNLRTSPRVKVVPTLSPKDGDKSGAQEWGTPE